MDAEGGGEFIADYYHPPNKTIGGDTSYFKIFRKHVGLSFPSIVGSRLLADLPLISRQHPFSTPSTTATSTSSSSASAALHVALATRRGQDQFQEPCTFSLGSHPLQRPHLLRQPQTNRVLLLPGQGSYISRSKHFAIKFLGLRDWIMDEKEVHHRPRLNSELAERHLLLEELFLDEPTKISSVLSFFLSFSFFY